MNLHQIASGLIGTVNPFINVTLKIFLRETEDAYGKVTPEYDESILSAQLQPLSWKDLQHLDGMNITGVQKKLYINGNFSAVNRITGSGGDFVLIGEEKWMIPTVLELWPDWCCLALRRQLNE